MFAPSLLKRTVAEFMATYFLVAEVVDSRMMAERLAGGNATCISCKYGSNRGDSCSPDFGLRQYFGTPSSQISDCSVTWPFLIYEMACSLLMLRLNQSKAVVSSLMPQSSFAEAVQFLSA
jgi:hypothetical protein